jgi:hypothetical protein
MFLNLDLGGQITVNGHFAWKTAHRRSHRLRGSGKGSRCGCRFKLRALPLDAALALYDKDSGPEYIDKPTEVDPLDTG